MVQRLGLAVRFAALVAVCSLPTAASQAHASTLICQQLETELAAAASEPLPSQARRYDAAIETQREQLHLARERSRAENCGFSLFGGGIAACGALNAKIEKMERNLEALQRKRSGAGGPRSRSQILAALDINGCRDGQAVRSPPEWPKPDQLTVYGGQIVQRETSIGDDLADDEFDPMDMLDPLQPNIQQIGPGRYGIALALPPGDYGTVCVRICDGYVFPMSSMALPESIARDRQSCEARCPGAEVELYYSPIGGSAGDMVSSVSGERYASLPTAGLYRKPGVKRPEGCGCGSTASGQSNFDVVTGRPAERGMNSAGSIVEQAGAADRSSAVAEPSEPAAGGDDRKVRVVGPTFLPDQEEAIDLRVPGLRGAR